MQHEVDRFLRLSRQGATPAELQEAFEMMAEARIWPGGHDLYTFAVLEARKTRSFLALKNPAIGLDPEDVAQEVLLTFYQKAATIQSESVIAWLRGVTRIIFLRDAGRHGALHLASELDDSCSTVIEDHGTSLEVDESFFQEVETAINGLTEALREVAREYLLKGLTYNEIATKLKIRPDTARTRMWRARHIIAEVLTGLLKRKPRRRHEA